MPLWLNNNMKLAGSWYENGWGEDKRENNIKVNNNSLFSIRKLGTVLNFF